MQKAFLVLGLFISFLGAVLLYFGSKETPWNIQTWEGKSENEEKFKKLRVTKAKWGFGLLSFGLLLQIVSQFLPEKQSKF